MQRERKDIEGLNGLLFFASEFAQDGALRFQLYDQHDQLQDDRVQKLLAAAELVRRDVGTLLERHGDHSHQPDLACASSKADDALLFGAALPLASALAFIFDDLLELPLHPGRIGTLGFGERTKPFS